MQSKQSKLQNYSKFSRHQSKFKDNSTNPVKKLQNYSDFGYHTLKFEGNPTHKTRSTYAVETVETTKLQRFWLPQVKIQRQPNRHCQLEQSKQYKLLNHSDVGCHKMKFEANQKRVNWYILNIFSCICWHLTKLEQSIGLPNNISGSGYTFAWQFQCYTYKHYCLEKY